MKKRILNTVLSAFLTIAIYWMVNLICANLPSPFYFFVAEHLELFNILFGGINFVIYILIMKRNERKNILLYYVSAMLWNWLAIKGILRLAPTDEGLAWEGLFIGQSLITLGILFFVYFIILKYLDYRRKRDNYVQ